jgi:lactase-phlorizin hydrolase
VFPYHFCVGQYGITYSIGWPEPLDPFNPDDIEALERRLQFDAGWFLNPIYVNGDYPEVMKQKVAEKSKAQNFTHSRLPPFSDDEKRRINRIADLMSNYIYIFSVLHQAFKSNFIKSIYNF